MDNAEAIISFIDEVTRNNETAVAVRGLGTAPIANWIWPFASFGQVRQAIDPLVLNGLATRDASGRKALEEQLYTILQDIVPKIKDAPMNPIKSVLNLRDSFDLRSEYIATTSIHINEKNLNKHNGRASCRKKVCQYF